MTKRKVERRGQEREHKSDKKRSDGEWAGRTFEELEKEGEGQEVQQGEQIFECGICIVCLGGKNPVDNSGSRRDSCLRATEEEFWKEGWR